YLEPEAGGAAIVPGMRVRVPFGRQRLTGLVIASAAHSEVPAERLKPVLEVLDPRPVLDTALLELLGWAAQYYHHPIGAVFAAALPRALRLGAPAAAREERWLATATGAAAWAAGEPRRAPKQRALLGLLAAGPATAAELVARGGARPAGPRLHRQCRGRDAAPGRRCHAAGGRSRAAARTAGRGDGGRGGP